MKTIQQSHLLFQVSAGVKGRYARLSRRGRIGLGLAALLALAWLLGLPQSLWRHVYVWLAYPVEVVIDSATSVSTTHGHAYGWGEWTANIDARYAWLHTAAHGGMRGMIAMEILLPLALLGLLAWRVGWFMYTRPRKLKPSTAHGSARWMSRAEMRALAYRGAPLLLGTRHGVTVAMDRSVQVLNTLLIGVMGSGKTAGFILSNILRETGVRDLVITDLKLELLQKAYTHLSKHYDVWLLNFTSPETSMAYNPLTCCTSPLLTALWTNAWIKNTGANDKEPVWDNWARDVMMPAIFHLQGKDPSGETVTLAHLDDFLNGHGAEWVMDELLHSPAPLARKAARGFMSNLRKNDKLLGSIWSEISPKFMLLSEPMIQATTSAHEIDLTRLGRGAGRPVALFIALDPELIDELRPLTATFFLDLYRVLGSSARTTPGGRLGRDVMIYADEWGAIGYVPRFTTVINLLRSAGVYGIYAVQTTVQLVQTYGEEGFTAIKAACATKIGLSNMVDDDATWFSESVLGQATEVAQSSSVQRGRFHVTTDRGGASQSETKRALLTPDEVMNIRADELLVKMPQCRPALLTQRRYYDDPEVMERAPAEGESWVSPLGPPRPNGPLVPPVFIDGHDEDTAPDAGPLTTEHEPTHVHEADAASDAGGVDGEPADDGADNAAGETAAAAASGVLGLSDDEEREYAQDYALTER
jgi:type IV secretion system protein VirD4